MSLMANILPPAKRAAIVSALTEGCSIRSTARMVNVSRNTVTKLLLDLADACAAYQREHLVNLPCKRVQADEIWSFVYAKAKNVPAEKTGQFVPATLSPALAAEVTALTGSALDALGVRDGVTHTEVKLTRAGPRIIEVNGRLGGYVGDIVRRASGYDLLRAAIQVAVRRPVPVPPEDSSGSR